MKFIHSADWHLRPDMPPCRNDENWMSSQKNILNQINDYSLKYSCPVFCNGDICESPRIPEEYLFMVMEIFQKDFFLMAGNHDLQYHAIENLPRSSVGVLSKAVNFIECNDQFEGSWSKIPDAIFVHRLIFPSEKDKPPTDKGETAEELLDRYPDKKWIFTGDYHHKFIFKKDGRYVVNPGCTNIQKIDMKDYKPSVYLVDTEAETIEELPLNDPIVFSQSYELIVTHKKERNKRITALIEQVKSSTVINGFSYLDSWLEILEKENDNNVRKYSMDVINKIKELNNAKRK